MRNQQSISQSALSQYQHHTKSSHTKDVHKEDTVLQYDSRKKQQQHNHINTLQQDDQTHTVDDASMQINPYNEIQYNIINSPQQN